MSTRRASLKHRAGVLPIRLAAWGAGPPLVAAVHWLLQAGAVTRMLVLIGVLFVWMKAVVLVEQRLAGKRLPPLRRLLAWLLLWPGMRPQVMARAPGARPAGLGAHIALGMLSIAAGAGCILLARWAWAQTGNLWAFVAPALIGCSLVLHYGLFTLVVAGWRLAGFQVGPLFRNPFASRSLADFWTRRWNLAYTEMCQESVQRATRGWGRRAGVLAVFLFSGLLHEAAISLPVNAGYGLPTLYFAVNGAAMLAEAAWTSRATATGEGARATFARAWAALWVIAPLPLLFHPWFLRGVVMPALGVA
ncbi:MAG: hypothetical protein H6841_10030 [Planctomycetes bacterium]|nr:hypothetical protein [Planctomycetota bacterium]MCB9936010.1 hypothetical protein [Planctomycetota bacterium]